MLQKLELGSNKIFCLNKLVIKVTANMENLHRLERKAAAIFVVVMFKHFEICGK